MDKTVSASKPFGLRTFYEPKEKGVPCQFIQRIGLKYADPKDVQDNLGLRRLLVWMSKTLNCLFL